jgi:hypothetical protein
MIDVKRLLNSIGKECYVKYFYKFKDNNISNIELVEMISSEQKYSFEATKTRVNSARRILKHSLEKEALNLIVSSKRVKPALIVKAKEIYATL